MFWPWLKFILCALVIFWSGKRLTKYGDILAEKSGMGRAWVGIVLLASVTSLPETANGISAVVAVGAPNLAVSNIFGACLYDLFFVALLDFIQHLRGRQTIFLELKRANRASAIGVILMFILAAAGIYLSPLGLDFSLLNISIYSIVILLVYLVAQRYLFLTERHNVDNKKAVNEYEHLSLPLTIAKFAFFSILVIIAGAWLPFIGEEIAKVHSLSQTLVGTLFLGLATTLPELTVSFFALSLSADMAVGNLLGSNLYNISLIFVDDVFYRQGSLLANVSYSQIYVALFNISLLLLLLLGMFLRPKRRIISALILVVFLCALYVLIVLGAKI